MKKKSIKKKTKQNKGSIFQIHFPKKVCDLVQEKDCVDVLHKFRVVQKIGEVEVIGVKSLMT